MLTRSPMFGARRQRLRSTCPCSSLRAARTASGYSTIKPWPATPCPRSAARVLDPASRIARSGVGRLTTVAMIHRTIAERGRPCRDGVAVVVDVRAGPVLREAGDLVHRPHPGGPTAADHVHRDSFGFQEMNRLTHERA